MRFPLLIAGAFLYASFAVSAAECQFEFDETVVQLPIAGVPVVIIEPADLQGIVEKVEAISGKEYGEVTRGFFAQDKGQLLLGLEVDGCLLPRILLGAVPAGSHLSGKDEAGNVGA